MTSLRILVDCPSLIQLMRTVFTTLFLCAAAAWAGATEPGNQTVSQVALGNPVHEDSPPKMYDVVQVLDEAGRPEQYRLHLITEVCMDGFCKQLEVMLIWDERGDYLGLKTEEDEPLTKRGHDLFTLSDYQRLDRILKNKQSILGQHPLSAFITVETPEGMDVLGGATRKNHFDDVVPGAACSTWVLWQWVHGDIVDELRRLTKEAMTDA